MSNLRTVIIPAIIALAVMAAAVTFGATTPQLMNWPDLLDRPKPAADRTIAYGTDPLNVVDLWLPKGKPPFPVVLMIHGGCWQTEIADRSIMNWISDDLRRQGIAVWNIEYRGVDRGGGYPQTYDDVAKAADLLGSDGAKYGLDARRSVVVGHSAGGHLGLWLGARRALPASSRFHARAMFKPTAIISQGGVPDLRMISAMPNHACGSDGATAMAGIVSPARLNIYADTSPPEMRQGGLAQILVNGDQDRVAPPLFASDYRAKVKAKGGRVDVITVADTGHVELIAPDTAAWAKQVTLIRARLGLKPAGS